MGKSKTSWLWQLETTNLKAIAREVTLFVLACNGGNRTQAARDLGVSIRALRDTLNLYRRQGHPVTEAQQGIKGSKHGRAPATKGVSRC